MLFSIIPGLKAARRIGAAERRQRQGDHEGAMAAYSEALEILGGKQVNLEMPWCRSAASQALWGYCRAAKELNRKTELLEMLTRWRATYLSWMNSPITKQEVEYLKWFEQLFKLFQEAS